MYGFKALSIKYSLDWPMDKNPKYSSYLDNKGREEDDSSSLPDKEFLALVVVVLMIQTSS